nr:MAG TPA: hypothetical protein [Caudoviricetes sp.]
MASNSSVSAVGDISPFAMRLTVDFDIPVAMDTCRTDRFFLNMILSSSIFIVFPF